MCFAGEVTEVRAIYTMFSTTGRPVRSEVTLNLSQRVEQATDDDAWDQPFDKRFPATGATIAGGRANSGEMGSIVSFGF